MSDNIWRDLPRPFFALAPMEEVTDVVFRHVVSAASRPDVFFTEFTNTESYCHPEGINSVRGRLTFTGDEQPIVAQIWGDKPDYFRQMSIGLAKQGFSGVDINMGCPVPNVTAHGMGSGLILRPEVAADLIQAAKAGGLPVSVKTRLGYTDVGEWHDWLTHVLKQDIANLTIHLRTKKEMSKVDAHWDLIPEIKQLRDRLAPDTLLTINGDVSDHQTGLKLAQQYGVDGLMIGRGIFANPFAFEKEPKEHSSQELLNLLRLHLDLYDQYSAELELRPFTALHRFFKIYVRGFRGAGELRNQLMNTRSTNEVRALLDDFANRQDKGDLEPQSGR
ncbi:tRNA-dihydrouridine synthase [Sporolactobacillus sp. CPB3-1]|uniref:tRNA-dihydrouridine synthase n=1 Tax=Sporolactobacillus mangiferae TaxID=2940498 RepID=A0ABT0MAP4_9BACL|nr:tRNA-dihydrouridine synthase [Sporolactobacillus mangiferae]MCL1631927.1 tRNA-dihydrouridine synthase [Sporolactobacillus mangiferae]